jgi:hypothetical protein
VLQGSLRLQHVFAACRCEEWPLVVARERRGKAHKVRSIREKTRRQRQEQRLIPGSYFPRCETFLERRSIVLSAKYSAKSAREKRLRTLALRKPAALDDLVRVRCGENQIHEQTPLMARTITGLRPHRSATVPESTVVIAISIRTAMP